MTNFTVHKENKTTAHSTIFYDQTTRGILAILNCLLLLASIVGNALVLAAMRKISSIHPNSLTLLCSLAVSDLLVGFVAQPIFIAGILTRDKFVQNLSAVAMGSACSVTLWTITAISVDRLMALRYHMRYGSLFTESRVRYAALTIWLVNVLLSASYFWIEQIYKFTMGIVTVICLIISASCYILIYRVVRLHQTQILAQQIAIHPPLERNGTDMRRLSRSAINTFIFFMFLIICYSPMYVILFLYGLSFIEWKIEFNFFTTLVFMNSSINPFLYCWRVSELRGEVLHTVRRLFCKHTVES